MTIDRRNRHVLMVVEDEDDLRELICVHLEAAGYACVQVANGKDVLELVRTDVPELIILDRMLPKLSGDDCLVRLKRDPLTAGIPVIMLTAMADETDQVLGFVLGADDYITKPFSMKLLAVRVEAVLDNPRANKIVRPRSSAMSRIRVHFKDPGISPVFACKTAAGP